MSETLLQKIDRMEKEILLLKNNPLIKQAKQVKQVDYSADIKRLAIDINKINLISKSISQKKEVDIELSIKKIVNINYITNLYRNK